MNLDKRSRQVLKATTRFWFFMTALGMWIFVYYVAAYYIPILLAGLEGLGDTHLPKGYIEGDSVGNFAIAAHLVLAIVIIGGGPLQLIPQIRSRFPMFHRTNGRAFLLTAVASSIAGLYMVWTRGTIGGMAQFIGISLDGILILIFAVFTIKYAVARNLFLHSRWALRLFIVAAGVWFYRVGLMAWVMLTGGAGVDFETFTGPFLEIWAFAQYLLPLLILELYFLTIDRAEVRGRLLMATGLTLATLVMSIGIFAATMGMWLPRIQ